MCFVINAFKNNNYYYVNNLVLYSAPWTEEVPSMTNRCHHVSTVQVILKRCPGYWVRDFLIRGRLQTPSLYHWGKQ